MKKLLLSGLLGFAGALGAATVTKDDVDKIDFEKWATAKEAEVKQFIAFSNGAILGGMDDVSLNYSNTTSDIRKLLGVVNQFVTVDGVKINNSLGKNKPWNEADCKAATVAFITYAKKTYPAAPAVDPDAPAKAAAVVKLTAAIDALEGIEKQYTGHTPTALPVPGSLTTAITAAKAVNVTDLTQKLSVFTAAITAAEAAVKKETVDYATAASAGAGSSSAAQKTALKLTIAKLKKEYDDAKAELDTKEANGDVVDPTEEIDKEVKLVQWRSKELELANLEKDNTKILQATANLVKAKKALKNLDSSNPLAA